jgi:hypothetical protein
MTIKNNTPAFRMPRPLKRPNNRMKQQSFNRLLLVYLLLSAVFSHADIRENSTWICNVKLVNSSTYNVYGHYNFGSSDETSILLGPGKIALLGSSSFTPKQLTKVNYRCDKADHYDCAVSEVDITKYFPVGNYKSISAVFTFKKMGVIVLSFEVSELDSKPGSHKEIIIGEISK